MLDPGQSPNLCTKGDVTERLAGVMAPQLNSLTAAELSGWLCSIHEYFDETYPANFQVTQPF